MLIDALLHAYTESERTGKTVSVRRTACHHHRTFKFSNSTNVIEVYLSTDLSIKVACGYCDQQLRYVAVYSSDALVYEWILMDGRFVEHTNKRLRALNLNGIARKSGIVLHHQQ